MGDITECVNGRCPDGWPRVYVEMRRLGTTVLQSERSNSLRDGLTAIVNEAWIRLQAHPPPTGWDSRAHYFGSACRAMRQALVDDARRNMAAKRKKSAESSVKAEDSPDEREHRRREASFQRVLDVDAAIEHLASTDPRRAAVAEMKLFGNLPNDLIAERTGTTRRTVERDWEVASAWLRERLG